MERTPAGSDKIYLIRTPLEDPHPSSHPGPYAEGLHYFVLSTCQIILLSRNVLVRRSRHQNKKKWPPALHLPIAFGAYRKLCVCVGSGPAEKKVFLVRGPFSSHKTDCDYPINARTWRGSLALPADRCVCESAWQGYRDQDVSKTLKAEQSKAKQHRAKQGRQEQTRCTYIVSTLMCRTLALLNTVKLRPVLLGLQRCRHRQTRRLVDPADVPRRSTDPVSDATFLASQDAGVQRGLPGSLVVFAPREWTICRPHPAARRTL